MTSSHRETSVEREGASSSDVELDINRNSLDKRNENCDELTYDQVCRLHLVMEGNLNITSNPHHQPFPCVKVSMKDLVSSVRNNLEEFGVLIRDVRLNGGAASYVLANDDERTYNDFDLIFRVDLGHDYEGMEKVKRAVLTALQDFLPGGSKEDKPNLGIIEEVYIHKMVKVENDCDRWSLISLANFENSEGCNVELKFVDRMRRPYEFSVDSFQILLDNLLSFYSDICSITKKFYPQVLAESMYGSFKEALGHLNKKQIATDAPEQIRGGGLLKYCQLVSRGYSPVNKDFRSTTEKYMCSRFFIDFPTVEHQRVKLELYLENHFKSNPCWQDGEYGSGKRRCTGVNSVGVRRSENTKFEFLTTLRAVVEESSVCLMGQERAQTLSLIQALAQRSLSERCIPYHLSQVSRYPQPPVWRWSNVRFGYPRTYCRDDRAREAAAYYQYVSPNYYSDNMPRGAGHMAAPMWPYLGHSAQYYIKS